MNKRELAQVMADRVGELGFNREHAIRCVNAFIEVIKEAVCRSPTEGEFLIHGFGKFRWHRYRGSWIREKPRVYFKIKMLTYQKNKFFDRCVRRLAKSFYNEPWFVGAEARKSMEGWYQQYERSSSSRRVGSIQTGVEPLQAQASGR